MLPTKEARVPRFYVEFATKKDYTYGDEAARKELTVSDDWTTDDFDLSSLAGKEQFTVLNSILKMTKDLKGYQFNLGQLTISNNQDAPQAPTTVAVAKQVLKSAQAA